MSPLSVTWTASRPNDALHRSEPLSGLHLLDDRHKPTSSDADLVLFFLPNILLSGFMFPFRGMPAWAQYFGEMLPLTHYLRMYAGSC